MARFYFFTDVDSLGSQAASDAFGPVSGFSDTQFQVTSVHRPTGATTNAYAVCDGQLLVQEAGSGLVNLILKPIEQPPFAFPKIKFFIYRGIQKSTLVSELDVAPSDTNDLTKSIWDSQLKHHASTGSSVTPPPPAQALGIDITGNGSIDDVFYRDNVSYQLPLVRAGWSLGEFDSTQFGFEIMVEAIGFDPELPIVRTAENIITVAALPTSPTQAQEFEYWHDKEAILNYIDPCAFFGCFYSRKLKIKYAGVGSVSKKTKNEIYDDVLKGAHLTAATDGVFFNRNTTYLDIRNEYNHSINYFKNYGTYSNTDINCAFEASAPFLAARNYYASTWPLMIIDNSDLPPSNTSGKNIIRLALPDGAGENPFPTLYISAGYLGDLYPREPKDKAKLIDLNISSGFTDEVALAILNRDGLSSTTAISSYIKLKYCKRFDPTATAPPASSGTVIRASNYLDNLFAPFSMRIPFTGAAKTKSVVYDEEVCLVLEGGNSVVCKVGMGTDVDAVTYFAVPVISRNSNICIVISSVNDTLHSSFLETLGQAYPKLLVYKDELNLTSGSKEIVDVVYREFQNMRTFMDFDPDDFLNIMVSHGDFATLGILKNQLLAKYGIYLGATNLNTSFDLSGHSYTSASLSLTGFSLLGTNLEVVHIGTNIIISGNANI